MDLYTPPCYGLSTGMTNVWEWGNSGKDVLIRYITDVDGVSGWERTELFQNSHPSVCFVGGMSEGGRDAYDLTWLSVVMTITLYPALTTCCRCRLSVTSHVHSNRFFSDAVSLSLSFLDLSSKRYRAVHFVRRELHLPNLNFLGRPFILELQACASPDGKAGRTDRQAKYNA